MALAFQSHGERIKCTAIIQTIVLAGIDQDTVVGERTILDDAALEVLHHGQRTRRLDDAKRTAFPKRCTHRIGITRRFNAQFGDRVAHRVADDHHLDQQVILCGEFPIALIMPGHRHHRAGAVTHQHEVGDPHRQFFAADRMDRMQAGLDAFLFLRLDVGLGGTAVPAFLDETADLWICGRRFLRQRMLSGNGKKRHAHQRIRTRGEDTQGFGFTVDIKTYFQTLRAPNPVALHGLDRIRPARQFVQAVQQFIGISGDLEEPLRNLALLHDRAGTPAAAVDHLLVREHGLVDRVPVDHRILAVYQSFFIQAHEHALLVDVVVGLAGGKLARPVDRVTERLQLCAHVFDIGVGPLRRRGVVLDRRVFRRQAERIPGHRLQHVLAEHALVAADHIADGVVAHMAHVQRAARIRQHRQAVVLGPGRIFRGPERVSVAPQLLCGGFDRREVVIFLHGAHLRPRPSLSCNCRLPQRSIRANPMVKL